MAALWNKDPWRPLRRAIGKEKVFTDPESLSLYGFDASSHRGSPSAVVLAVTTDDVRQTVEFAREHDQTITPRGAGSGLSGGSVPVEGGIVLSCERMKTMESMDPQAMTTIVQPGVVTHTLQENVRKYGLFYPPDPSSHTVSTIGGNVAENAGGLRCFKYGVTGHYVLGVEYVNAEAEVRQTGIFNKGVFEPDLTSLLVGSEGTLGVITHVALRLIPAPEATATVSALYADALSALGDVEEIVSRGWVPSVLEFMDGRALDAAQAHLGMNLANGVGALLLVELDGARQEVEEMLEKVQALLSKNSIELGTASTAKEREDLWQLRRAVSPSLSKLGTGRINEDLAVPRGELARMAAQVKAIGEKHRLDLIVFGHAGDGNLHIIIPYEVKDRSQMVKAKEAAKDLYRAAIEIGGTITGEHGIGRAKREFLPWQQSEMVMKFSHMVKKTFDPHGIFNPGKVFV